MVRYRCQPEDVVRCKFCASTRVVKNGSFHGQQRWICRSCDRLFVDTDGLPYMKTETSEVADAVDSYFKGMSLNQIRDNLDQQYHDRPSDSTIYRWVTRFSKVAVDESNKHTPQLGDTWVCDEMVVRVAGGKGNKLWLWNVEDERTRYLIASRLSATRGSRDAELLIREAIERAKKTPRIIRTDKLASYIDDVEKACGADCRGCLRSPETELAASRGDGPEFNGVVLARCMVTPPLEPYLMHLAKVMGCA